MSKAAFEIGIDNCIHWCSLMGGTRSSGQLEGGQMGYT